MKCKERRASVIGGGVGGAKRASAVDVVQWGVRRDYKWCAPPDERTVVAVGAGVGVRCGVPWAVCPLNCLPLGLFGPWAYWPLGLLALGLIGPWAYWPLGCLPLGVVCPLG
eukprot:2635207-Prymnesium_polylepis.2